MSTGFVVINKIVFANVIFQVEMKAVHVSGSRAELRDNLHISYTGAHGNRGSCC